MAPIAMVRGQGSTVWDRTGKAYLDLLSGTWCNVLGYGHTRWVEAVREQVSLLTHVGPEVPTLEVNEALAALEGVLPSALERALLLASGSEAVELALKMAHAATGRKGVAVIEGGYYGATAYALSLSEAGRADPYLPDLSNALRVPAPTCRRCPAGRYWPCETYPCLSPLRDLAGQGAEPPAAVMYEPVMAVAGVLVPPPGYGRQLRDLATSWGALLISEEVTTGVGRTGRWFGFEHEGIVPDLLVLGKALGGGLPVSAVVTTAEVEERCHGGLRHVQSHQNDPFLARVAATVISVLKDEGLIGHAAERGAYLLRGLQEIRARRPLIWDVRGKGLMLAVELEQERAEDGLEVFRRVREAGFIVDYQPYTATFRLFPPYVITTDEIDRFLSAFDSALAARG